MRVSERANKCYLKQDIAGDVYFVNDRNFITKIIWVNGEPKTIQLYHHQGRRIISIQIAEGKNRTFFIVDEEKKVHKIVEMNQELIKVGEYQINYEDLNLYNANWFSSHIQGNQITIRGQQYSLKSTNIRNEAREININDDTSPSTSLSELKFEVN